MILILQYTKIVSYLIDEIILNYQDTVLTHTHITVKVKDFVYKIIRLKFLNDMIRIFLKHKIRNIYI